MSLVKKVVEMVDTNKLYNHILSLEGIKHALDSYTMLIKGAEYIEDTLKGYGLFTERSHFSVEDIEGDFYNVVGSFEKDDIFSEPSLMVTNHFDTVYSTPGADDNASGVAVMLEVARILSKINYGKNVLFVSFNLEEFAPTVQQKIRRIGQTYGIYDKKYRFNSWPLKKYAGVYKELIITKGPFKAFLDDVEWKKFESSVDEELRKEELEFFRRQNQIFRESAQEDPFGVSFCLGSTAYAKHVVESKMNITGVINLESVGFTSSNPYSQRLPPGISMETFDTYKVDQNQMIGNFITVIGDKNSKNLVDSIFTNTQHNLIDLPCACLMVPMKYEQIKLHIPDLLRSDHAPFWRLGIPAVLITDTANFRNPYYHTGGDTINTLDFPFMKKICQMTLISIIQSQKNDKTV